MNEEIKKKITSMGMPLTTAQWLAIDVVIKMAELRARIDELSKFIISGKEESKTFNFMLKNLKNRLSDLNYQLKEMEG